ncbi:LytR/AlgR family response regulator transcription factor [Reichenbachiella sp.]|uniref:LytR/AlgR family response regulator transcription factor n=1 Tax=Reichenbachiella sp. TaxID=2184521 RepID=UPI003BB035A7
MQTNEEVKPCILIVEDEALLALDLALRLSKDYKTLEPVESVEDALSVLENYAVDLLIIDISLKGEKDGIDLATRVKEEYCLPFIFLSSHSDQNIVERAKRANPYAYLIKPYNDREISIAIELALSNYSRQESTKKMDNKIETSSEANRVMRINDCLFLKKNTYYERVSFGDISFLEADNNYTTVYTKSDKYIYSTVLKKMEEKLPVDQFLRVHRSYVININAVTGFEGNMLNVHEKKIPVSKQHRDVVFRLFETF